MPQFQNALGATNTFSITNGVQTTIIALSNCRSVTVGEDGSVSPATTTFKVAKPLASSNPRTVPIGGTYNFIPPSGPYSIGMFKKGQIVGFITTNTGTTTFFQDEQ